MLASLFRASVIGLVRLYYPTITTTGAAPIPAAGPVIVVANHPNGLLDPLIVALAARRPLAFLAKSTFWTNPVGRFAVETFGALPVYRAHEADTRQNEATFAACRALLAAGGGLALFPEGKSHSEPALAPLKTGAARIALSAEAERGFALGVTVVPVGLHYEDKAVFRTRVAARVGEPVRVADLRAAWEADPRAAAGALTDRIAEALAAVVVEAESVEVRRALDAVAAWTDRDAARDVAARADRARALAAAWRRLRVDDPPAAEALAARARTFADRLRAAGVHDPWSVDAPAHRLRAVLPLVGLALPALAGALLAWLPYRAVRPVAERYVGRHDDVLGTVKLLLGTAVLIPVYLGWAAVAGALAGPWAALGALVGGPLTGLAALRFDEAWALRRGLVLRPPAAVARELAAERDALAAAVTAALTPSAAPGAPPTAP